MVTILQFLIQSLPIFIITAVSGFLLALVLLRRSGLALWEIFFVGIPLGMAVPAMMAFIEFNLGISYSSTLYFVNLVVMLFASSAVILADSKKEGLLPAEKWDRKTVFTVVIFAIVAFLAFWIRIQALSPEFYEFDPYWYNHITQFILTQGGVPLHDDFVWYPNTSSHRGWALVQYIEANWYSIFSLFNGIQGFDFTIMTMISSLYPPIVAALLCFFGYLWLSREYGRKVGLVTAAFLAFTPVLVDKMLAGEFELQPWGLFSVIFFYATYYLALKNNSKRFAILAAFALAVGLLGAGAGKIPPMLFMAAVLVSAVLKFLSGDLNKDFIVLNGIVAAGSLLAGAVAIPYLSSSAASEKLTIILLLPS